MKKTNFSRLPKEHPARTMVQRVAGGMGVALLLLMTGAAVAQQAAPAASTPAPVNAPLPAQPTVQDGFVLHETVDLGGHMAGISGSGAMYDTLINIHPGPRVLGETFTLHAVPGSKHALLDSLTAFSSGFGGDPNNYAKLDFSKGKLYEFNGTFRRDRQYFDYDLLGNVNIPSGEVIPATNGGVSVPWAQLDNSPVMFNTVRRMTDTNLTLFPLSKLTFRVAYSQNIFQGPSLSPGEAVGAGSLLLEEYQRNSTDDFIGAVDWKPFQQTKFTYEEEVDHYKGDSYFTLAPQDYIAQEADGTPVALGVDWYNKAAAAPSCNGSTAAYFTASPTGGLPIVNPACNVATSYFRSEPTRILYPTEIFRFQSSSIKNIAMNGDVRYSRVKLNLPNYYENFQGLDGVTHSQTFTGSASGQRQAIVIDYGITWQAIKTVSISDQVNYDNVHQPGAASINEVSEESATTGESVNYSGTLTAVKNGSTAEGSPAGVIPYPAYFGQKHLTNNATVSWDATPRATFSLTYRYSSHLIAEGAVTGDAATTDYFTINTPLAAGATNNGTVTIHENGGIFNAALRPTDHWTINGTAEVFSADNAFTPLTPRQTQTYRVHTIYRPRTWATVSGSYLDTEHKNNTNNTGTASAAGPLDHVDHSRKGTISADLTPNEHYGFDFTYGYSDVYTATNICYDGGSTSTIPGAATVTGVACPGTAPRTGTAYDFGPARDFMDAPTQFASAGLTLSPVHSIQGSLGYTISAVSGNQFFNDAQAVNGSLQSAYQSPYVHIAWTVHPGWIWKADYNYYGYGEGGPSGAPLCSNSNPTVTTSAPGVPCNSSSIVGPTGLTEPSSGLTAPRNFHANVVTISMHYEF